MSVSSLQDDIEQEEYNQVNGVVTVTVKGLQELRKLVTDLKLNKLTSRDNNKQKSWNTDGHMGMFICRGNCNYKADGHIDKANYTNRKGGSELRLKKVDKKWYTVNDLGNNTLYCIIQISYSE